MQTFIIQWICAHCGAEVSMMFMDQGGSIFCVDCRAYGTETLPLHADLLNVGSQDLEDSAMEARN